MIARVNGFICLQQPEVALAQRNIDPARPHLGPQPLGPLRAIAPQSAAAPLGSLSDSAIDVSV